MKIVINHLTRMRAGYICAAGVDPESQRFVRPVLQEGALPFDLLTRYGGPFDVGREVELGATRPNPKRPHVEDRVIVPAGVKSRHTVPADEFWEMLRRLSKTSLSDIFGDALRATGHSSCVTDLGTGEASLGFLRPRHRPQLRETTTGGKPRIRLHFSDGSFNVIASVTDLRLYGDDHVTPDRPPIDRARRRLLNAEPVILGVGLTRPVTFPNAPEPEPVNWLQVTNLHFQSDPTWQLG